MKKTAFIVVAWIAAAVAVFAAEAPRAVLEPGGQLSLLSGKSLILTQDHVALQDAQWKVLESPMSRPPVTETKGGRTVTTWKSENAQIVRSIETPSENAVSITWQVEFNPGITGGKFIELTLLGPKNSWSSFPLSPTRTIATSRSWIEVKPDAGTLYFDFTDSTGSWKFEEMRNVNWLGHLRLLYFSGYDFAKGTKFTAKLTISNEQPGTQQEKKTMTELRGNGDEYSRVVLPPEMKDAAPLLTATFHVATRKPLRRSSSRLFGYNNDWHGYKGLEPVNPAMLDPDATANPIDPKLTAAAKGIPVPLNRTAGTDSQLFQWRKSIGPNRERQAFPLWFGQTQGIMPHYGLVEHFNWFRSLDPKAEFVYVVNLHKTTPEESRELAEFLTGGADTPLGKLRISYGMKDPVIPAIWELGNEMDLGGAKHMDVGPYVESCRAHIEAIRKAYPDAVFSAHAACSPWDPERGRYWRNWNQTVLKELGKDIAYFAFHPYYRGLTPKQMLSYMDELVEDIAASPNPAIQVFNSEHAKWPPGFEQGHEVWKRNWYQTHALIGVLDTAEWMLLMLNRPEVGAQTYHAFSSGPWGLIYRDKSGEYYTTGIAELFRFFEANGYDNTVVHSHIEGVGADPRELPFYLTGAAELSPDGKTLSLTVNNRLPASEWDLKPELDDPTWKPVDMTILSAPELESVNSLTERPITTTSRPAKLTGGTIRIPAKSLTRITWERN